MAQSPNYSLQPPVGGGFEDDPVHVTFMHRWWWPLRLETPVGGLTLSAATIERLIGTADDFTVVTEPATVRLYSRDAFCGEDVMDSDLEQMTREELVTEVRKLRQGIREHRDSSRHELCWHHPSLWGLLPEKTDPLPVVPEWPEFMRGCVRYRQSLDEQAPNAPRTDEPYEK